MPGIAIKIIGANYSASGLGKVTLKGAAIPVTAIAISGSNTITNSGQYAAVLTPSNTTQTRVVWSITSGGSYASIDQNGLITAKAGASNSSVTIKCTSADNSSIYGTKTIRVTYVKAITGITISGPSNVTDSGQFSAALTPSDTTQTGLVWSIISGGSYASIDQNGLVTVNDGADEDEITIKCASSANPSIFDEKLVLVTKQAPQPASGLVTNGLIRNYDAKNGMTTTTIGTAAGVRIADAAGILTNNAEFYGTPGNDCVDINTSKDGNNVSGLPWEQMLNGLGTWTLEFTMHNPGWVNTANEAADIYHDISSETNNKHVVYLGPTSSPSTSRGHVAVRYSSEWKIAEWIFGDNKHIDWSTPHVIHVTREESTGKMDFKLYVDGELYATASTSQAGDGNTFANKVVFLASKGERHLYAIRAYNRALTAAEILQNAEYNIQRYGFGED